MHLLLLAVIELVDTRFVPVAEHHNLGKSSSVAACPGISR
jgi:hypothetical protein